jgi:hypothetical protein
MIVFFVYGDNYGITSFYNRTVFLIKGDLRDLLNKKNPKFPPNPFLKSVNYYSPQKV